MGKGSANECMVFPFCEGEETQSDRKVLTCSGSSCDVRVHPECYGLDEYAGKFSCDSCKYASGEKVTCVMCPSLSGAFKKTVGGKYIHVVCALWTKCEFGDIELLSGISITNVFPAASKEEKAQI
ncbi:hypothetical protein SARC_04583 [Sphaeroforma arctica JP610]|uniref:PHD-type domain-containing protein n=1 Tax=Sphaeroforma arctica JP610 TaxID=667725 RepID=A0A0L0G2S9_9EUKA|nr:hypothetical protein SARC_04583 [Sphaeroforma arctica JP610]KNC83154.1 hypothetical protein SARC_04583 [Sphaeroforma arctica JP610]|eukprot:XP_014157056.1 hypothetical protein SARC_04583 [Sphaeroforma arctica JP610]